jgi:DNA-binding PadR family transcriptional regulator
MASTVQQSEMSASEIVLGLLIERPDACYQLDKRIAERLGSAQFSRGSAAGAVRRLLERDLVRALEEDRAVANGALRAVDGRRKTVYEATPAGVEHFRRWLRSSTQTPPVREELHAKIALWASDDLSRLIEIVREAEVASMLQLQELNRRTREERGLPEMSDWEQKMQLIVSAGEVSWWDYRIKWLQDMRLYLEKQQAHRQAAIGSEPGWVHQS